MTDLKLVIDAMLPGDPGLGMPGASLIDFDIYLKQHRLEDQSIKFIQMLDKVCEEKYAEPFVKMDMTQKMKAINACKLVDARLFSAMVGHLLKAYYTTPEVLKQIGAGSVPPFPQGNSMTQDDWSILEPVYMRGQVYRDVT